MMGGLRQRQEKQDCRSVSCQLIYAQLAAVAAIAERNVDALASHVDFPALRSSINSQLEKTMGESIHSAAVSDNPFAAMGQAMVATMLGKMVDAMVSPEGVAAMISKSAVGAQADQNRPAAGAQEKADYFNRGKRRMTELNTQQPGRLPYAICVSDTIESEVEQVGRRRGCISAVLYTISVQAPDFYAQRGRRQFGES